MLDADLIQSRGLPLTFITSSGHGLLTVLLTNPGVEAERSEDVNAYRRLLHQALLISHASEAAWEVVKAQAAQAATPVAGTPGPEPGTGAVQVGEEKGEGARSNPSEPARESLPAEPLKQPRTVSRYPGPAGSRCLPK